MIFFRPGVATFYGIVALIRIGVVARGVEVANGSCYSNVANPKHQAMKTLTRTPTMMLT